MQHKCAHFLPPPARQAMRNGARQWAGSVGKAQARHTQRVAARGMFMTSARCCRWRYARHRRRRYARGIASRQAASGGAPSKGAQQAREGSFHPAR